jgi:type I restriction enzyme, R subunit
MPDLLSVAASSLELQLQQHIADFLVRVHHYTVLEQTELDPEYGWSEDALWAFIQVTQAETLEKLIEDYSTDARDAVFRALREAVSHTPLWCLLRNGLQVRGLTFRLFYPLPRSSENRGNSLHVENRFSVRPHFYFGKTHEEIDLVLYLNGLPIVALELKHEGSATGWNVHHAAEQFAKRDHGQRIFQLPFLYLAADTSEVKMATDPRKEANFRWFNTGLTNAAVTDGEYPIEYLYREVLSPARLLEALSFFLVYVTRREATDAQPERAAYTLFPRYHQQRMVRNVADTALQRFVETGQIGQKFLINHSAGSGKTLSICWLADRLHSLYHPSTSQKLVDMVIILTDRKSLDKNIRDDIENFSHLKDVIGLAKKAEDLSRFLRERRPIIVSTQQKFAWILETIQNSPALACLRVAYLIDEAHRSQEGQMGVAIRLPFRQLPAETESSGDTAASSDEDAEETEDNQPDDQDATARIIREHDHNQIFVAFTATPSQSTLDLFGEPFDTYSEAEAIQEGYIVDVAGSILSYETLYHLHCTLKLPEDKDWPAGVVAKALRNVAYQDEELIQYKAEVMLCLFEERVKPLINGSAKAMIVATSRLAGLRYFRILQEKLRERDADYKVLYAFSDFVLPGTNETIREHDVNELDSGELIEDRFEGDAYRLIVVANKFLTGFDQPLLAGMFLDKSVVDRNAVQTVSRLNRAHEGKKEVIVVDFTNNAKAILKAFRKYRRGSPFEPGEPDASECERLYDEILATGVFVQKDADELARFKEGGDDARVQAYVSMLKLQFEEKITTADQRNVFVHLLAKYVKSYYFLSNFFTYQQTLRTFAVFAEIVGPQLIKRGTVSELMKQIHATSVVKAAVRDLGETTMLGGDGPSPQRPGSAITGEVHTFRVTVDAMIEKLRQRHTITDDEALIIKEVIEEKTQDEEIRTTIQVNRDDKVFLDGQYKGQIIVSIRGAYSQRDKWEALVDPKYSDDGGIFDIMAHTVIGHHLVATHPALG